MNEMIERVAKAIYTEIAGDFWDVLPSYRREEYLAEARAAIESMREPTEAMCLAVEGEDIFDAAIPWAKMIDAALVCRGD